MESRDARSALNRRELVADLFRMLGDPTRLTIISMLLEKGPATIQEISRELGKSESLVAYHLSSIKRCTLIIAERSGKNVYYRVGDSRLKDLISLGESLAELHCRFMIFEG